MKHEKGTFDTIPKWVRSVAHKLPGSAGWALLEFAYRSNYRDQILKATDLMLALEVDQRTAQRALKTLSDLGHIVGFDGQYCLSGAVSTHDKIVAAIRKSDASLVSKLSRKATKLSPSDPSQDRPEQQKNVPENIRKQENIEVVVETEQKPVFVAASAPSEPEQKTPALPSQEKDQNQGQPSGIQVPSTPTPNGAAPLPQAPALSEAAQFFKDLCGEYLLRKHAGSLDRWYTQYGQEGLKAIWAAALHVRESKPRMFNLVDLLEGTLAMPKSLQAQLQPVSPEGDKPQNLQFTPKLFDPKARMVEELLESGWDEAVARKAVYG